MSECETCGGRGEVAVVEYADSMNGYLASDACPDCHGTGKAERVELPSGMTLSPDFGDVESLWNSREWLREALRKHGATEVGAGMGGGQADVHIELEGHGFVVSIRPVLREVKP